MPNYSTTVTPTTTSTTTTTTSTTTSTTTTTTTTTVATACQSCVAADITLDPSAGITPVASPVTTGAGGCSEISVTCTAPAGMNIFMDFDNGQNNPDDNQANPVIAMFSCNAMGMWEYTSNIAMQSYVISTISCFAF
uniref:C6 domain-containing protein n=1 Tax=Panagrolaimus sp. PS1159 TaxID=55785 RepID=A0AC35FC99_9BILA